MEESEKENLFITFQQVIESIIKDKRKNPKNIKFLNKFKAKINLSYKLKKISILGKFNSKRWTF